MHIVEYTVHPHCFNFFIAFNELELLDLEFVVLAGFWC
jgi:hypothetical protein